jgi:hypothetical protein
MDSKEILLESLTEEQKKTIQRNNPFVVERNILIRQLYNRGVAIPLLVEISGISRSAIHRIAIVDLPHGRGKSRREWIIKYNQEGKK